MSTMLTVPLNKSYADSECKRQAKITDCYERTITELFSHNGRIAVHANSYIQLHERAIGKRDRVMTHDSMTSCLYR